VGDEKESLGEELSARPLTATPGTG